MNGSDRRPGAEPGGPGPVAALFESQADAEEAIQDLKDAGFPKQSIGVVLRDPAYRHGSPHQAHVSQLPVEPAAAACVGGGILGGVVGLVAGVGALALPGMGPVIAGGMLTAWLAGDDRGAAARGVLGTLIGLGIPDRTAPYFEDGVRQGSVLVVVESGSRGDAARDILRFSRGDLGRGRGRQELATEEAADMEEAWRGSERRYREDPAYGGPERRLSHN